MTSETKNVPQLINVAGEIMERIRLLVRTQVNRGRIAIEIEKLKAIQESLDEEMRGIDIRRVISYIDKPDSEVDRLVELYRRKFFAILLEDYERAKSLNEEIEKIEKTLSQSSES